MKRKRKIGVFLTLICLLVVGVSVLFTISSNGKKKGPEYIFTYADNQPEDYPTTLGAYRFAELVEERTGGRIKIQVQANGVLGAEQDALQQVIYGGVDFIRVSLSSLTDMLPELNVLQMPYLYRDSSHMWRVLEGDIGTYFMSCFDQEEMVPLSWYDAGVRNFYSAEPIRSLNDLRGKNVRVQETELMIAMIGSLGAIAVPMAYADIYSGFQKKMIDVAENNWPSYDAVDHYEVAKFYTVDEHTRVPELQLCSRATWNRLEEEDKQIIRECAMESALYERQLWAEREKQARRNAVQKGAEVIMLEDVEKKRFEEAVTPIYEQYCLDYMDIIDQIKRL